MGINVLSTMGFDSREFQNNSAKKDLQKNSSEQKAVAADTVQENESAFVPVSYEMPAFKPISTEITLTNSLKETLQYLQNHARDKRKKYILGELWESMEVNKQESLKGSELLDFEIDDKLENIFAA